MFDARILEQCGEEGGTIWEVGLAWSRPDQAVEYIF